MHDRSESDVRLSHEFGTDGCAFLGSQILDKPGRYAGAGRRACVITGFVLAVSFGVAEVLLADQSTFDAD